MTTSDGRFTKDTETWKRFGGPLAIRSAFRRVLYGLHHVGTWPGSTEHPIVLDTLSDYVAAKLRVYAHCSCCGHHKRLDIEALARKKGGSLPVDFIRQHIRCTACRERRCWCQGRLTGLLLYTQYGTPGIRQHWSRDGNRWPLPWFDPRTRREGR